MRCPIRHRFFTFLAIGPLWLFIIVKVPKEIEDDQNVEEMRGLMPQDSYSRRKDPRPSDDWEDLAFKYMKKSQQRRKTWLAVGISFVPGEGQKNLLHTLASLFRASSKGEQKHLTVLVHLADSDFTRLRKTVEQIAGLFSPQILAGKLVLIHAPSDAYPTAGEFRDEADGGNFYSKQNVDHAFLMSVAAKLSDYFLLLDHHVFCAPGFITHIRRKVEAMGSHPWVLLEFSNLGLLGKLFRSRDLPLLAHFLLLFSRDKPLDRLIPHFRTLLAQKSPLLCRPFLFYHRLSYYTVHHSHKARAARSKDPFIPDNPPGAVFTDMQVFDVHFPWEAYTLDESFFWTYNASAGSHLTVILNHPANLSRVQVLTGTVMEGKFALEKGRVELGYEPQGVPQYCSSYSALGGLLQGQLDQELGVEGGVGHEVSCVKLVVAADQAGGLLVRHIYLWEQS